MPGNNGKKEIRRQALLDADNYIRNLGNEAYTLDERINELAERRKKIEVTAGKKHPLVKEYIKLHKDAEQKSFTRIGKLADEMKLTSTRQRRLKIAAQLCKDPEVKGELEAEYQEEYNSPVWDSYEKYIQGLEYLAGITTEVSPEVKNFFQYELCELLPVDKDAIYEKCRTGEANQKTGANGKEYDEQLDAAIRAKNIEYQKQLAPTKARELFAKNLVKTFYLEAQFVGEGTMDNMPNRPKMIKRMTPAAFCAAKMLAEGASLEDVLDPKAFVEQKKAIGAEYLKIYMDNDLAKYVDEMYKGAEALIQAFDKYAKAHKGEVKTEQDLAMHANMLGVAGYICMDLMQELQRTREYSKTVSINAINDRLKELDKRTIAIGMGGSTPVMYNVDVLNAHTTSLEITRQLQIKMFLEELRKDEPDFDNNLLSSEEWSDVNNQLGTMDELQELFDGMNIDIDNVETEEIGVLVSMMNNDFVNKNKIRYECPRVPVEVTKATEVYQAGPIEEGYKLSKVVTRDGKQLVQTTLSMELELENLEKENLRGKRSGNSEAFNGLLDSYDQTIGELKDPKLSNKEYLEKMQILKDAAAHYIRAKREQKGYPEKDVPNLKVDNGMMGIGKGRSIFTTKGRDRYKFAMQIVLKIDEMEKAIKEEEKKAQLREQHKQEKVNWNPEINRQESNPVVNQEVKQPVSQQNDKLPVEKENKIPEQSFSTETISKAKILLKEMTDFIQDKDEYTSYASMSEIKVINPDLAPMDFLVNELKLGPEERVSQASLKVVMECIKDVIATEKTNEAAKEQEENDKNIEDDFEMNTF